MLLLNREQIGNVTTFVAEHVTSPTGLGTTLESLAISTSPSTLKPRSIRPKLLTEVLLIVNLSMISETRSGPI